tara:strand:+ start:1269 stop:1517 length:249 start_codon:yes stop_codon:yes gene_type:complete
MTNAPEKIWAYAGSFKMWRDHKTDATHIQTEYTRTDVCDARIKELEGALRVIEGGVVAMNQPAEKAMRSVARAALKGDANEG